MSQLLNVAIYPFAKVQNTDKSVEYRPVVILITTKFIKKMGEDIKYNLNIFDYLLNEKFLIY